MLDINVPQRMDVDQGQYFRASLGWAYLTKLYYAGLRELANQWDVDYDKLVKAFNREGDAISKQKQYNFPDEFPLDTDRKQLRIAEMRVHMVAAALEGSLQLFNEMRGDSIMDGIVTVIDRTVYFSQRTSYPRRKWKSGGQRK